MKRMVMSLTTFDTRIFYRIFGWHGKSFLDTAMIFLTRSADGYYYGAVVGALFLFGFPAARHFLLAGILAYGMELTLYSLLKHSVKRDRPYDKLPGINRLLAPPDKFSFPSGHTAAAFVMASLLASYLPALFFAVFAWAWLVGLSRIYMGLHFPTDVLAGAFLGVISARTGILIETLIDIPFSF